MVFTQKIYFNTEADDGGLIFKSKPAPVGQPQYALRFAGHPKFLLTEFKQRYGLAEGEQRYKELLSMLLTVDKQGFSPFVLYLYP